MASVDGRTGQSGAPPDTVRCASHVTQPLGFDRWSSDLWGHRTGPVDYPVRLLAPALTSARAGAHCSALNAFCRRPLTRSSRCSTGTPDSPMNYRGAASQIPEADKFSVDLPGAPDTVRWHTGQSGAPDQGCLWYTLLLCFEPFLLTLYWFVVNL
jgi:hypothetical protein